MHRQNLWQARRFQPIVRAADACVALRLAKSNLGRDIGQHTDLQLREDG
jgi:hypothetical protein